jgi:putative ABC transport system permease protein
MRLGESVQIGLKEISSRKLRSFLTMLGVIFGVAAVVSMVAIGSGAREEALRQIKLLGTNNIRIRALALEGMLKAEAMRKSPFGLTLADAESLKDIVPNITNVAVAKKIDAKVFNNNQIITAEVVGTLPDYPEVVGFGVQEGRFINNIDLDESKMVCVIGNDIKESVFGLEEPLNKTLRIGFKWFTVVGVMERKSVSSAKVGMIDVGNLNQKVYIPISTGLKRYQADRRYENLDEISVKVRDGANLQETANVIERVIKRRHNDIEDFEILIPEELLRQSQRTQRIFTIVLTAIAGISLIVGGIGIMNIMLATVTQRTREIGVRRAIGATKRDILSQFIIESLVISLMGGFIGIFIGVALANLISNYAGWKTIVSAASIIVSFSVAAATGLLFGIYPAMKAAQLDPIEALRYE